MSDCSTVERTVSADRGVPHPAPAARRSRVLVVDDDPTNRRVLQGMLGQLGYDCAMVEDGAQAVQAVIDGAYGAVLMDCLMPIMDGYDATRAIRQREQHAGERGRLPVIAVTALAMEGARDRCLNAGMDDYLTKPVMLENLERVLARWIADRDISAAWRAPQSSPAAPQDGPIDEAILDELRALGEDDGPALIAELVRDFRDEVSVRFPAMRAAISAGDMGELLRALHFVAGCSAIVGAREVERLARSADARRQPASLAAASALVDQLEAAYREAKAYLSAIVEASPS